MLGRYIAIRLLQVIPVLFAIVTIEFLIVHLAPGNPALILAGPTANPQYIKAVEAQFGLNKPLIDQYFIYLWNLLHGNLGTSVLYREPVVQVVGERVGATLLLVVPAWAISLALGIFLGTKAGLKRGSWLDRLLSLTSLTLYSIPVFWLAVMLVAVFAIRLNLVPIAGIVNPVYPGTGINYVLDVASHMILPLVCMIAFYMPQFYQLTRTSVASTLEEDFPRTLQAAGLERTSTFSQYILKNASLPVITLAGLWVGYSLTGAVLIEVVFAWPGLGSLLFNSALGRDYPVLLGIFLIASILVIVVALATDILCVLIDPRMRLGRSDT